MNMRFLFNHWRPLVAFFVLTIAVGLFSHIRWKAGYAEADAHWAARWNERDALEARLLAKRQQEAREEEKRRQEAVDAISTQALEQIAQAKHDAAVARTAADSLHRKAKQYAVRLAARERTCRAGTPGGSQTETASARVLAELFARADERAGKLAEIADEARARGQACEASWEALRNRNVEQR